MSGDMQIKKPAIASRLVIVFDVLIILKLQICRQKLQQVPKPLQQVVLVRSQKFRCIDSQLLSQS